MAIDTPPQIERLDRALPALGAEAVRLSGRGAEMRHLADPLDHTWERLAVEHPEACSTAADYPGWAEHVAALAATNHRPKEAS
ncbi:hypothetical protein [Streptomyces spectabilis]|nr:hypothetical protein [Streptomyces spectabilis]MBB5108390.1 hypothetical protein [Streptomyces spectabilis]MCI3901144.1 hypothetical protein [Streptomyces spectabilis]GGV46239.1 hypothetical protein GCM10010245_72530 [Streptomyces spectabilis]